MSAKSCAPIQFGPDEIEEKRAKGANASRRAQAEGGDRGRLF
jgi:hypothetical protein